MQKVSVRKHVVAVREHCKDDRAIACNVKLSTVLDEQRENAGACGAREKVSNNSTQAELVAVPRITTRCKTIVLLGETC